MGIFAHAMPLAGFAGGLMIGLAASLMLLADGRVAGVSGLAARAAAIGTSSAPYTVALAFTAGLPLGAFLIGTTGNVITRFPASPWILIIGGLLVGYGTWLGSGCTSGHGVCGLSRVSPRSLAATFCFMAAGMIIVFLMKFIAGVA
ncbi:MAG: hypothetical protein B7Z75_01760 [Acidocella sp. 20-57-95]|nr:MAG: hypothetical protein B7Z75_01760 [Acidocella sp. 20-57-95]HQT63726.1 YeeE/YedE thiosulfate transporter family protein [Acidocella sp.]HQU05442.1 YeeE/YedE thiosulfate transporter family protein [Acidocella sp.]